MTTTEEVANAIWNQLDFFSVLDKDYCRIEYSVDIDPNNPSNLIIATSDGCHFKVIVVRDE